MMMHAACLLPVLVCLLALSGCVSEPLFKLMPAMSMQGAPPPRVLIPVGAPSPIPIPGVPPPPREEQPRACDDDELHVPGHWDYTFGEWAWIGGFCARRRHGYVYMPPSYDDRLYVRGHFVEDDGESGQARLRPARRRFVHPKGMVIREPFQGQRPALAAAQPNPRELPMVPAAAPAPPPMMQPPAPPPPPPPGGVLPGDAAPPQGPAPSAPRPSRDQCMAQAVRKGAAQDPECSQVLGGELRVR